MPKDLQPPLWRISSFNDSSKTRRFGHGFDAWRCVPAQVLRQSPAAVAFKLLGGKA
jgi:hypothetical protein